MKRFGIIICILFSCIVTYAQKVYETSSSIEADVTICEVQSPIQADVIVYKADNPVYPGIEKNKGIWWFAPNTIMANINICKVPEVSAQLKVYYTNSPVEARWVNPQKKYLMALSNN